MRLTPTEDLVMEVLAARFRLGENLWTFSSQHRNTLRSLASKGLVISMGGVNEGTVRAALTNAGKQEYLNADYVPPAERKHHEGTDHNTA